MADKTSSSFVSIPKKQDFTEMVRTTPKDAVQALCHLPCGQPCVCSCHVNEDLPPQTDCRF